jgi:beta-mannosidase
MIKQPLHDHWTIRAVGDLSEVPQPLRGFALPAQVPGCVTTDLLRAGKIADPYLDENEFQTRWIGHTDWQYTLVFDADSKIFDHERIDLVADGLDTVAQVYLNGSQIAQTQNMHRGYRFDVRAQLKKGRNELTITFASPVKYANTMWDKLGGRPYCNGAGGRFNFIRKMACNFGWDWGPALPTCGIWRGIRLEGWNGSRAQRILLRTELNAGGANLYVSALLGDHYDPSSLGTQELVGPDGERFSGEGSFDLSERDVDWFYEIPQPHLWWPSGHGNQPLYQLNVEIAGEMHSFKIGLRTVELDTSPDDIGRKFILKVNGKPIFCKGFNWIPDDCFLDRACEPARVRQRIQQAVDAGGNMLRVWGGGIYETDDFYNICDEMGVLVWQDFLFACAMYPEEEPFRSEVEAEARYNVARLAHHPSLALWNGCNENIWAYRDWGWKDAVKDKTWGKGFYFDLLPNVCKELTPTIPYWAGSPWSGDYDVDNGVPPNAATHGNKHIWDAPAVADYRNYRTFEPRFASEFGVQGPANYSTIARVVPPESRDFGGPAMRHRQKAGDPVRDDADRKNLRQIVRDFNLPGAAELLAALDSPDPKGKIPECGCGPLHPAKVLPSKVNFDDLHYLLSVQQCRALTTAVEYWRSRQPTCWGTLYWQLNDCWPGGTTWSCIDGDGKPKPLWYATRKFFAPRLLTFQPQAAPYAPGDPLWLCAVNDTDETWRAPCEIWRQDMRYPRVSSMPEEVVSIDVPARSVHRIALQPALHGLLREGQDFSDMELLAASTSGLRAHWYFHPDQALDYPSPQYRDDLVKTSLKSDGDRHEFTLNAGTLLRDVCIFADRVDPDAVVDEQMVALLPFESFTFVIRSKHRWTVDQFTAPPVFRCVNPFGKM